MTAIRFFVPGTPAPGGSKKAFRSPNGRIVVVDDCDRNKPWRDRVASFALEHWTEGPIAGPLSVTFSFVVVRPRGHFGSGRNAGVVKASAPTHPTTKPDTTKLVRAAEDALKGILWIDDAQIVEQAATKRYGDCPGVEITVIRIEEVH